MTATTTQFGVLGGTQKSVPTHKVEPMVHIGTVISKGPLGVGYIEEVGTGRWFSFSADYIDKYVYNSLEAGQRVYFCENGHDAVENFVDG